MKACTVYGDMTADRAGDQYPTVNVCDDCIEEDERAQEDAQIVSIEGKFDDSLGNECFFCEKSKEDEDEEL